MATSGPVVLNVLYQCIVNISPERLTPLSRSFNEEIPFRLTYRLFCFITTQLVSKMVIIRAILIECLVCDVAMMYGSQDVLLSFKACFCVAPFSKLMVLIDPICCRNSL